MNSYYLLDHPNPSYKQFGEKRRHGASPSGTIVLHDAENTTDLDGPDSGAEAVAHFIATRKSYGSYHMLVDRDSIIFMLPWEYEAWHCGPTNNWSVGISVAWTKAQLAAMGPANREAYHRMLAEAVMIAVQWFAARGITVPIDRLMTRAEAMARKPGLTTHSRTDFARRSDPWGTGSAYENEFLAVLAGVAGQPVPPPVVVVPPKPSVVVLDDDGQWGEKTTRRFQQVLGTPVDGVVSNQLVQFRRPNPGLMDGFDWTGAPYDNGSALIRRVQSIVGSDADGHIGPDTITKMQRRLGTHQDGYVSNPSAMVKALQRSLNAGRF